jgi:hypothetical protein
MCSSRGFRGGNGGKISPFSVSGGVGGPITAVDPEEGGVWGLCGVGGRGALVLLSIWSIFCAMVDCQHAV